MDVRIALIDGDSDAGRQLRQSLSTHGMPDELFSTGFRSAADLSAPRCAASSTARSCRSRSLRGYPMSAPNWVARPPRRFGDAA